MDLYLDLDYQISSMCYFYVYLVCNSSTVAELLQCIQNLHRLQTLDIHFHVKNEDHIYDTPPMTKISTLPSILTSVSSGSALHDLRLSLHPTQIGGYTYLVDRRGLLDMLVGGDLPRVYNGFPSLSQLIFKLYENDEGYDNVWWKEEMVRRLPSHLHAAVRIEFLDMSRSMCFSSPRCSMLLLMIHYVQLGPYLWFTKNEINIRELGIITY